MKLLKIKECISFLLSLCLWLTPTCAFTSPLYNTDHFEMISSEAITQNSMYSPHKKDPNQLPYVPQSPLELPPVLQKHLEKITASHIALIFLTKNSHGEAAEKEMQHFLILLIEFNYLLKKKYRGNSKEIISILKDTLINLSDITSEITSEFSFNEKQRAKETLKKVSNSVFGEELNQAYQELALQSILGSKAKIYPIRIGILVLSAVISVTLGVSIVEGSIDMFTGESVTKNILIALGIVTIVPIAQAVYLWKKLPSFAGNLQYGFQHQLNSLKDNYSQCLELINQNHKNGSSRQ